jgi:hypothetical protein
MRLQLIVGVAIVALAAAAEARAEEATSHVDVDARSGVYDDSDRTFVSTSTIGARANPTKRTTVKARYLVDVISSASVDVVTAATGRFQELRNEVDADGGYRDANRSFNVGYTYSGEHDWWAHTGRASYQQDFLDHVLTFGLSGSFTHNIVGRSGDDVFRRNQESGTGALDVTIAASRRDLVTAEYTFFHTVGFQSSPYRYVFLGSITSPTRSSFFERLPEERTRHALGLRWNHMLFRDTALRLSARLYGDDWGIVSATAGAELVVGFGDFEIGGRVRGYLQRRADFYRPVYATPQLYMSADRETSSFADVFAGGRLGYRRPLGTYGELRAELKVDGFYFRFFDFPRLPERTGVMGELAVGVSF